MFRAISTILALIVFGLALFRFGASWFKSSKSNPHKNHDQKSSGPNIANRIPRWSAKNIFLLPHSNVIGTVPEMRRGEAVVLLQSLSNGQRCAAGLFLFIASGEHQLTFRLSNLRKPSTLENWAQHEGLQVKWEIIKPEANSASYPFIQKCERWMHSAAIPKIIKMVASRSEVFLKASEFPKVSAAQQMSPLQIQPDYIRGGWRVSAPEGGTHELLVYSNPNRLRQKLTIQFPIRKVKIPRKNSIKSIERPNKFVGLPGWD